MNKEILYKFFEGTTSLEEEIQIKEWMEASPENKRTFFKERKLFDTMTLLADQKIPNKQTKKKQPILHPYIKELLKVAAIALLVFGGNYLYQSRNISPEEMAMQTLTIPAGQRVNLTLPDGTNIWLNALTTIKYPISFNSNERYMELDGEAYFEVKRDEKKPFKVHTSKGIVEVLGTDFNIEAYSAKEEFETTLMQGSVKVKLKENPSQEIILTPDKKTVLREGKLYVENVDNYEPYRWREGLICFRNESFTSIMNDFEKYYGVSVKVKNQTVLKYFYTGKFRHTDGIDYALRVLQKDIHFTYSRDDENQIIYTE